MVWNLAHPKPSVPLCPAFNLYSHQAPTTPVLHRHSTPKPHPHLPRPSCPCPLAITLTAEHLHLLTLPFIPLETQSLLEAKPGISEDKSE